MTGLAHDGHLGSAVQKCLSREPGTEAMAGVARRVEARSFGGTLDTR